MFSLREYLIEIQILLDIFMITAIVILAFLYLKISVKKKQNPLVAKIEYLCKNLKVLLEESDQSSEIIQKRIDDFKCLYEKNLSEIEKRATDINEIITKLELNDNIKERFKEKDNYTKIKKMLDDGYNIDDIAKMLKISKGEVELISKLKV